MVAVSEFVIRTAMRQMREWDAATGRADLRLAVNISAVQVQEGGLVAMCDRLIADTGFDPRRVELELTESGAMRSSPSVHSTLTALRERGFHLSIDDFGTGYSSLSRLERLPIDVVKIDRSFVQGIGDGGRGGALVRAVIAMGRSLGLRLVGEGVETEDQLAFLEAEGCDFVQGYLLARPQPAEQLTAMLAAGTGLVRPRAACAEGIPAPAAVPVRGKGGRSASRMAALD
jgi:EAL domain-containing protein (putative c-di-GMP-specific phosphodiesterase class I)